MVNLNAHVSGITAYKTNDTDMGQPIDEPVEMNVRDALDYLDANPRHALVIVDVAEYDGFPAVVPGLQVAVFRGASYRPDNFYVQPLPLEDPNDADGGDWTAEEAIADALDLLCNLSEF